MADENNNPADNNNQNDQGNQGANQGGNDDNPSSRGFASMDPERVSEIASMGGRAAHEQGVAHEFTSEEAREAGRKGGEASHMGNTEIQ